MTPEEYQRLTRGMVDVLDAWLADNFPPEVEQYGTSMHYPGCVSRRCTGCIPGAPVIEWKWDAAPQRRPFDLSIFRKDLP